MEVSENVVCNRFCTLLVVLNCPLCIRVQKDGFGFSIFFIHSICGTITNGGGLAGNQLLSWNAGLSVMKVIQLRRSAITSSGLQDKMKIQIVIFHVNNMLFF